jgi:curved DNA-binding protein CbpA
MLTPYLVLDLEPDASNDAIRQRYLEEVKRYPPAREPERFERIATAYEQIKDDRARIATQLFGASRYPDLEQAIAQFAGSRRQERGSPGLSELLEAEGLGEAPAGQ